MNLKKTNDLLHPKSFSATDGFCEKGLIRQYELIHRLIEKAIPLQL